MILQLIFILLALLFLYTGGKNISNRDTYIKILSLIFLYQGVVNLLFIILYTNYKNICNNYKKNELPDHCKIYGTINRYVLFISIILLPIVTVLLYFCWNVIRNHNILYISTIMLLIYLILLLILYITIIINQNSQ